MIQITVAFRSVAEALAFLRQTQVPDAIVLEPNVAPPVTDQPDKPAGKPEVKKRGRPAKAAVPESVPPAFAEGEPITKRTAFVALERVINEKGYDAGRAVLKALGAARFPEVKAEQYAELIDLCAEAEA